ncbi:hypothetical protein D932_03509 [Enterococcus casseliflavus 14-MB-W-14]|nr:hypothetical protein D932_03509 [Enterococcus casseliflavus 14-MB-W-14]
MILNATENAKKTKLSKIRSIQLPALFAPKEVPILLKSELTTACTATVAKILKTNVPQNPRKEFLAVSRIIVFDLIDSP